MSSGRDSGIDSFIFLLFFLSLALSIRSLELIHVCRSKPRTAPNNHPSIELRVRIQEVLGSPDYCVIPCYSILFPWSVFNLPDLPNSDQKNALTIPCNAHIGFNTSSLTSPSPISFQVEWQEILHRCQVDVLAQLLMCGLENVAGGDHVP